MKLLQFVRIPAAFIAANWAGLLGVFLLVGAVPAFAGNQRVTSRLDEYADEAGMTVLRQLRRTWWRDLPATLAFWTALIAGVATVGVLVEVFDASTRVFFVGLLLPVYWAAGALLNCYVRAAATLSMEATRGDVTDEMLRLALRHPLRAATTVLLVIATTPVWILAPITVACGLSVPAWVLGSMWKAMSRSPRVEALETPALNPIGS